MRQKQQKSATSGHSGNSIFSMYLTVMGLCLILDVMTICPYWLFSMAMDSGILEKVNLSHQLKIMHGSCLAGIPCKYQIGCIKCNFNINIVTAHHNDLVVVVQC